MIESSKTQPAFRCREIESVNQCVFFSAISVLDVSEEYERNSSQNVELAVCQRWTSR